MSLPGPTPREDCTLSRVIGLRSLTPEPCAHTAQSLTPVLSQDGFLARSVCWCGWESESGLCVDLARSLPACGRAMRGACEHQRPTARRSRASLDYRTTYEFRASYTAGTGT